MQSKSIAADTSAAKSNLIAAPNAFGAASTDVVARVPRAGCNQHGSFFTLGRMIKDRPHRLDLIYINQPLYFITFSTRDRKKIPSLDRAQGVLED
jgi:hypothetical protein